MSYRERQSLLGTLNGQPGVKGRGRGSKQLGSFLTNLGLSVLLFLIISGFIAIVLVTALREPCPCSVLVAYSGTVGNATDGGVSVLPDNSSLPLIIAILGDQGLGEQARRVLRLVRAQNASIVLHQGDFDYKQAPKCWVTQLFKELQDENDPDRLVLDYFAAMGNHEFDRGLTPAHGYTKRLRDQLHPEPAQCCCQGRVGVRATCVWRNVVLLQIGLGCTECFTSNTSEWASAELARLSNYPWKFCMFHKTQRAMQLGQGGDDVGWPIYQACRAAGAIIVTGHDHRYARTHLMSSFGPIQTIASTDNDLAVSPGFSFVALSALAGYGIREAEPNLLGNPWWAASLNLGDPLASFGALFIRIGDASVGGNASRARAEFLTIDGDTIDSFTINVV